MKENVCSIMNSTLLRTALIRFGHISEYAEVFLKHLSQLAGLEWPDLKNYVTFTSKINLFRKEFMPLHYNYVLPVTRV